MLETHTFSGILLEAFITTQRYSKQGLDFSGAGESTYSGTWNEWSGW